MLNKIEVGKSFVMRGRYGCKMVFLEVDVDTAKVKFVGIVPPDKVNLPKMRDIITLRGYGYAKITAIQGAIVTLQWMGTEPVIRISEELKCGFRYAIYDKHGVLHRFNSICEFAASQRVLEHKIRDILNGKSFILSGWTLDPSLVLRPKTDEVEDHGEPLEPIIDDESPCSEYIRKQTITPNKLSKTDKLMNKFLGIK